MIYCGIAAKAKERINDTSYFIGVLSNYNRHKIALINFKLKYFKIHLQC
jgi:hypothetical protein